MRLGLGPHARAARGRRALLAAFVAIERRSRAPLMRLSIFRSVRSLAAANVG